MIGIRRRERQGLTREEGPDRVVRAFAPRALVDDEELVTERVSVEVVERLGREFGEEDDVLGRRDPRHEVQECALSTPRGRAENGGERAGELAGNRHQIRELLRRSFADVAERGKVAFDGAQEILLREIRERLGALGLREREGFGEDRPLGLLQFFATVLLKKREDRDQVILDARDFEAELLRRAFGEPLPRAGG